MSARVDLLRFERTSYAVAWRDFIKLSRGNPGAFCCFFEGEDLKYYGIRIDLLVQVESYRSFSVGGRTGVLQILDLVLTADGGRYARHPVAFFVDRDFVPPSSNCSRLYVTPGYSMENFFVKQESFERILAAEFRLDTTEQNYLIALDLYCKSLDSFNSATRLLNGWLRGQRMLEAQVAATPGGEIRALNLRDVKVWEFVDFGIPTCNPKYTIASLDMRFGRVTSPADEATIWAWVNDFDAVEAVSCHRGKFLMQFFVKFLARLAEDLNRAAPALMADHKSVNLSVHPSNAISQFSQYAETPSCLRSFLEGLGCFLASQREASKGQDGIGGKPGADHSFQ